MPPNTSHRLNVLRLKYGSVKCPSSGFVIVGAGGNSSAGFSVGFSGRRVGGSISDLTEEPVRPITEGKIAATERTDDILNPLPIRLLIFRSHPEMEGRANPAANRTLVQ